VHSAISWVAQRDNARLLSHGQNKSSQRSWREK
jgi:hypothetical protein